ncbi:hypothetical protein LTR91_012686 [Friedmanniomyces endolithicus]|uniref:Uncharacterized protein n=1 Tax=Friedmanniomyces endolithicus TaxID=329885 RepID=A0AAN6KFC3_9PEZI|nr:hypothetical protein LTR57_012373 [Friedmanniomyces endolithicus]KAK0979327.1 hypothetical protein LTR91_012686 [Friedmanniomyces endolithicus]KAK1002444.1 hypothetical protein LTS01_004281 [Friedmanniomyces endolithicus]KAK1042392.1 hypothetical protein LTS16_008795 [Friedmanniomyces endolithicus]
MPERELRRSGLVACLPAKPKGTRISLPSYKLADTRWHPQVRDNDRLQQYRDNFGFSSLLAQAIAEDVLPPGLEQERMLQVHARHAWNLAVDSPKREKTSARDYEVLNEAWGWACLRYSESAGEWRLKAEFGGAYNVGAGGVGCWFGSARGLADCLDTVTAQAPKTAGRLSET